MVQRIGGHGEDTAMAAWRQRSGQGSSVPASWLLAIYGSLIVSTARTGVLDGVRGVTQAGVRAGELSSTAAAVARAAAAP